MVQTDNTINTASIEIPDDVFHGWQQSVDLIASLLCIPSSLIMRLHAADLEVFVSSDSKHNPYTPGEKESLGKGLYCEAVIKRHSELLVANALIEPEWDHNPDISLGMISYCGLPLDWPNGDTFGTICMLDNKENAYNDQQRQLLERCQKAIEASLTVLYQKAKLELANQLLESRVQHRTSELVKLNKRLSQEIGNRTSAEKLIYQKNHYDTLTGLPNRKLLEHKLTSLKQHTEEPLCASILHVGINNIKAINDNFGYHAGDKAILSAANRLHQHIPTSAFLAHLIGHQFVILLPSHSHTVIEEAAGFASTLCGLFNTSIHTEDLSTPLSVSIGVAIYPHDADDIDELIRKSSTARSFNRTISGSQYQLFNIEMQSQLNSQLQIEYHITNALKNNELALHYQPFICTDSGKTIGAEALLRWHNPVLGNVPPDQFIPIAEQNGHIMEIGSFVLRSAIEQASQWHKSHHLDTYVAVNISPIQFRDNQLASHIIELLTEYALPPQHLEVEITEGVLLQDEAQALTTLNTLAEYGVRISLDDFGTGYSSLSYLQKFPFDTVKIDRSFIASLTESSRNRELVNAIIAMARNLNLHVVAEGIETTEQANFITQAQCEIGQGYLYGKPDTPEIFLKNTLRKQGK